MGIKKTLIALFCASTLISSAYAAENALSFDGIDDRITVGDNAALEMGANFSLSVWINPTAAAISSSYANIALKGQHSIAWDSWNLTLRGGKVVFAFGNGNGDPANQNRLDSTTTLTANTWAHIAVTYDNAGSDGKNLKIYINGVEDASSNPTATAGNHSSNLQIGGDARTNGALQRSLFSGVIDELSLWNKTLSAADITAISAETFTDNGGNVHGSVSNAQLSTLVWSDLSAYFTMNEGTGTTIGDSSSSALSGSFANSTMPTWVTSSTNPGAAVVIVPPALNVATVTGVDSFDFSWTDGGSADSFTIEVATDSGFSTMVSGDYPKTTAGGIILSESVSGLTGDTPYYYRVKATEDGVDSAYTSGSTTTWYDAGTTGGAVYPIKDKWTNGENRWATETVTTTGATVNMNWDMAESDNSNFYNDRTTEAGAQMTAIAGSSFTMTVAGNEWRAVSKVWIDWNQDGLFEDATEAEFNAGTKKELAGYVELNESISQWLETDTFSVAVPASFTQSLPFTTRVRVAVTDGYQRAKDTIPSDGLPGPAQVQDFKITVTGVEITGYDSIPDVSVKPMAYDLAGAQALLPTTVTISGTSDTRAVTWRTDSVPAYDNSSPGTYLFTAQLGSIPAGYKDDTPETMTVNVVVQDYIEITGYDSIPDVSVKVNKYDLAGAQALLPATVTISGTSDTRAVTWRTDSVPAYDNRSHGTYLFTAQLGSIPAGYKDDSSEVVKANVIVENYAVRVGSRQSYIKSPANFTGTAFSFSGWVNVDSTGQEGYLVALGSQGQQDSASAFGLHLRPSGGLMVLRNAVGSKVFLHASFPTDQWVHLAITGSTTENIKMYINGVVQDDVGFRQNAVTNGLLNLGTDLNDDTSSPTHSITKVTYDEVAVFSTVLTPLQVERIYNSGAGGRLSPTYPDLKLYWKFEDDPQGTTVADADDAGDSAGTIHGAISSDFNWVKGKTIGDLLTPTIGLEISIDGTELTWSAEDEIGVKEYQIIVDGQLFDTVKAIMAERYVLSVPAGTNVLLKVVDLSGFTDSFIPGDGTKVTEVYDLEEGWNLIAITSDNADIETLKNETVGLLWRWNGNSYEAVNIVEATDAVWVYTPIAKQLYVSGPKTDAEITLSPGWNMVGPVENDYIPEGAHTVYSWSKVYDEIIGDSKVLIGGKGYWIFSL